MELFLTFKTFLTFKFIFPYCFNSFTEWIFNVYPLNFIFKWVAQGSKNE